MVNINDIGLREFTIKTNGKKLFIWGAGIRARRFLNECDIAKNLIAIVDNNNEKQGDIFWQEENRQVIIIGLAEFVSYVRQFGNRDVLLLITPVYGTEDILKQLNNIEDLNDIECYIGELLLSHYEPQEINYKLGKTLIPKKIHYCWFGKNEIPLRLQKCIKSWHEKCPDYEIIRWDENNYDIKKNTYMREAYESQKWGFVPDYARLDIVYNQGGIYLDTDVELLKSLDRFLTNEMFCGFSGELSIAMGLCFGAVKGHDFVKRLMSVYDNKSFYEPDGSLNLKPCVDYQNPIFKAYGFDLYNQYQEINNIVLYPSEVFSPLGIVGGRSNFTENTVSVHYGELSWVSNEKKSSRSIYGKLVKLLEKKTQEGDIENWDHIK